METVAQGRVWSGQDAASRGLVDSLGGFSQALAIAKQKANIPHDRKVSFAIDNLYLLNKLSSWMHICVTCAWGCY